MQIPIFVISLSRATDRRAFIAKQMQERDLEFEFFEAVDGRKLTPQQEALVDRDWRKRRSGNPLRPSEIGASMSHALLYRRIVEEDIDCAIILEDDATLGEDFPKFAKSGILQKSGEDMILFHVYRRTWARKSYTKPLNSKYNLYRFYSRPLGACGYFVTNKAARRLHEAALPIWMQPDWPLDLSAALDAKGLEPPIIFQNEEFESQLQVFASRRTPFHVRIGRMCILPTIMFPKYFGNLWLSLYTWQALAFNLTCHFLARKPRLQ